jgi:hypothetical protein
MTSLLHDRFDPEPLPHWNRYLVGRAASLEVAPTGARLVLDGAQAAEYSDSQLDDSHGRQREEFLWIPPLRLTVRARFSHPQAELRGTAGFGWWNAPFEAGRATNVALGPQVLWFFFGSAPSNLAATPGWSGQGWFAQGMKVPTLPGWFVKLGMLAMRLPLLKTVAQQGAGTVSRAAEQPLPDLDITQWHEYVIAWESQHADFFVDGEHILRYDAPPTGPLALVLWMDNQWATIDGAGGLLNVPQRQWLELGEVQIDKI